MQQTARESLLPGTVVYRRDVLAVRLSRRYKRFLADCNFSEGPEVTTVHCPNTGPMIGLLDRPDAPALCSVASTAGRKYANTLEAIQPEQGGSWVGIHSALANKIVEELIQRGGLESELGPLQTLQREVKYGKDNASRVDFLLTLKGQAAQSAPSAAAKAGVGRKRPGEAMPDSRAKSSTRTEAGKVVSSDRRGCADGSGGSNEATRDGSNVNLFSSFRKGGTPISSSSSLPGGTGSRMMYVEVKNVTLISGALGAPAQAKPKRRNAKGGVRESAPAPESAAGLTAGAAAQATTSTCEQTEQLAFFPDAVSVRAHRHMEDLMGVVRKGHEAAVVFLVQRNDCQGFAPCRQCDPHYADLVAEAAQVGVKIIAVAVALEPVTLPDGEKIELQWKYVGCLPVHLK
mmetsp:Transcript_3954/g.9202  ORF Transcript_3954/g.9202 Transcript_3954/m.9202 type:complete len:402 (-) Transcript_3954:25-1230(-)